MDSQNWIPELSALKSQPGGDYEILFPGRDNMISRQEIIDVAIAAGLIPHVVEKDSVLGRLPWGINSSEKLSGSWVFKGGTCLKKYFFET